MSCSIRARLRSQSQQSLPRPGQQPPDAGRNQADHGTHEHTQFSQSPGYSFASASTATLPERHIVFQAVTCNHEPSKDEDARMYITGAEFVTDAWRRKGKEGVLDRSTKRRKRSVPDALQELADGVLWYTAPFVPATTGGLKGHSRHWSPRQTPPLPESLPQLESLPPRLLPQIGPLIELWSTRPMAALDPVQEENTDFEYGWKTADGSGWGRTIQSREESQRSLRWSCDDVTESQSSEMITKGSSIADDYRTRRRWWSQHMLGEEGFNRLWDVVPRPHTLDPLPRPHPSTKRLRASKTFRPPDYVLPRFFALPTSSTSHPFHPRIHEHIKTSPSERVYWAIPIVGPVYIPDWSDHITSPTARRAPVPASGKWVQQINPKSDGICDMPSSPSGTLPTATGPRLRSLTWTDALVKHFWEAFLVPLYTDQSFPFGSISVRLSGPKPDPHLDLVPPTSLRSWSMISPAAGPADSASLPVRPEMGDHIRLYCDARYALSLRTWLNSIEVELSSLLPDRSDILFPSPYLLFKKIRLVLVGSLGEALIVA